MALFRVDGERAQQVRSASPRNEKQVQSLIERSLDVIFGVRFVTTEFPTGERQRGRIDTLGVDQDGSPVILEYKQRANENIINQGLFYLDWLMDHRGDFEIAARRALGQDVGLSWAAPRLILLAESFGKYDLYAVNRIDERIELWAYRF
jgi:RecB family endonuclease NucS